MHDLKLTRTNCISVILNYARAQHRHRRHVCPFVCRFNLPRQQWSLLNYFRTEQGPAVPAEGNGDLQTLICVLVARPRRCLTLSNPVP